MNASRALVTVVAVACAALVGLLLAGQTGAAVIAKLIASTAFVVLAIKRGALNAIYGRLILAGLTFSWFGDMFLTGDSQQMFLAGLAAFLLGHLAFASAFVAHGYHRTWIIAAAVPLTGVAIAVWTWLEPHTPADLSMPVRAYIAVITIMVIFAFGTRGRHGSWLIVAGATLFFLSDLSVAALRLLQTPLPTYVLGLPAYYAAQVCFALSVSPGRS
jgi:uncharacterized membrane protein YhhN